MDFTSISFLVFVAGVVIAFNLTPSHGCRSAIIAVANAIFIVSYVTELSRLAPLVVFLLLGYATVGVARIWRSTGVLAIGIAVVLCAYVFIKRFSLLDGLPNLPFPYVVVGVSYILFRVLHLAIDGSGGSLREPVGPLAFFNYTCNFLCFVSGPIQRYQDFTKSTQPKTDGLNAESVFQAFRRIISGYIKVIVVSGIADYAFLHLSQKVLTPGSIPAGGRFVAEYSLCALTYTTYLYFNFSGYMDIVIGIGKLLGEDLPENFNRPFGAVSFLEFWSRWHMTLSDWFKTYLFNPIMKALVGAFPQSAMVPYLGGMAFFVTFFVMGIWHGTTMVFAIYGLVMGVGASANKMWQLVMIHYLGRKRYRLLGQYTLYCYGCRGLTCAYFTVGVTCLWVDMDQLRWVWRALGPSGWVGALLFLATGCGTGMYLQDLVRRWSGKWRSSAATLLGRGACGNLWSAAQILLILIVSSFFHRAPEFVYRTF
jgi:alginate O-acetyltransferase complex protein AlgI